MKYYAGLDISNKETSICIVDENGNIVKEAKVQSDPESIDKYLTKTKLQFEKIGLETGSLTNWLATNLIELGWNIICIDSRYMSAILSVNVNKTDRNDARAIANSMRCGSYKEVYVKSQEAVATSCLLTIRRTLVEHRGRLNGVIRGTLKTFGVKLSIGKKSIRELIEEAKAFDHFTPSDKKTPSQNVDWTVIESLIVCVEKIEEELKKLNYKIENIAKDDKVIQRLITHPGVGVITAMTYKAVIDDPTRFKKSRSVGAHIGMAPRQFSSGELTRQGKVSKNGSKELRSLLHEAGVVLITRTKKKSRLKSWGLKKKRQLKTQKAGMAVGRKIAVNLHKMWLEDKDFDPQMEEHAHCPEESHQEEEKQKKLAKKLLKTKKI